MEPILKNSGDYWAYCSDSTNSEDNLHSLHSNLDSQEEKNSPDAQGYSFSTSDDTIENFHDSFFGFRAPTERPVIDTESSEEIFYYKTSEGQDSYEIPRSQSIPISASSPSLRFHQDESSCEGYFSCSPSPYHAKIRAEAEKTLTPKSERIAEPLIEADNVFINREFNIFGTNFYIDRNENQLHEDTVEAFIDIARNHFSLIQEISNATSFDLFTTCTDPNPVNHTQFYIWATLGSLGNATFKIYFINRESITPMELIDLYDQKVIGHGTSDYHSLTLKS